MIMPFNSFLGDRNVVKSMLNSKKAEIMISSIERYLFDKFGHISIRIFGWPLAIIARRTARIIFEYLKTEKGKFLDVGCSFGTYTFALAKRSNQVIGLDIDKESLKVAKEMKNALKVENVSFICENILSSGFQDSEFDVVVMGEVLEHIQDDEKAIREVNRILVGGGVLVISVPYSSTVEEYSSPQKAFRDKSGEELQDKKLFIGYYHCRSGYNDERLIPLLSNNGFDVEGVSKFCLPKKLPRSEVFFCLIYPLSFLASVFSRNTVKIIVKARKRRELYDEKEDENSNLWKVTQ